MTVTTQSKSDLVSGEIAAVQANATGYVDFSIGSIPLAFVEAVADVALWLQGLILFLLATIRAATSQGPDLDSWYADFGTAFSRQPALAATVNLTFSRLSTSGSTYVPVSAFVQTPDGSQTFVVGTDTTNPTYDANAGGAGVPGYVLANTVASVIVPSQAQTPGAASNVGAGTLTVITSAIVGIDTVTNGSGATGGADAENDTSVRARWPTYLGTLARATNAAVQGAALAVQPGLFVEVLENQDTSGNPQSGNFVVVVDDGSGSPPSPLLASVAAAVETMRGLTATFQVIGPSTVTATVSMTVTVGAGYIASTVSTLVHDAIFNYIDGLTFGVKLPYTKLAQLAYDASPGVTNVSAVLLNGTTADLVPTAKQLVRAGTVTITTA